MSLAPLDLSLPTDSLHVTAWADPVVDQVGHDPRSGYAERFWLPILGPSTYLLLRQLVTLLDDSPDGAELPLLDGAHRLGLGTRGGRNAPFLRAINRAIQFKVCRCHDGAQLEVRRHLAPLTRQQVSRLAAPLRDAHDRWQAQEVVRPDVAELHRRARRLALSLAELGEPDEGIEQQLHRWQFHPAMAAEAVRWARVRSGSGSKVPTPPPPRHRPGQTFDPAGDAA